MSNEKTATAPAALLSLADLDLRAASDATFEFEYIGTNGAGTGVFLTILGEHSEKVTTAVNAMINERRRMDATREANATTPADNIMPVEDDVAFGQRVAAVRLVGWRGIQEDFTPERGLQLCRSNPPAAAQIMTKSRQLQNFTKA